MKRRHFLLALLATSVSAACSADATAATVTVYKSPT